MTAIKEIRYSSHFLRSIKALPLVYKEIVRERIEIFKVDCFDSRLKTHKLKGRYLGFWSFSITHSHRVIFEFIESSVVGFVDIGDHSVYQ